MQVVVVLTVLALLGVPTAMGKPQANAAPIEPSDEPTVAQSTETAVESTTEAPATTAKSADVTDAEDASTIPADPSTASQSLVLQTTESTTALPTAKPTSTSQKWWPRNQHNYTIDLTCQDMPTSLQWCYRFFLYEVNNESKFVGENIITHRKMCTSNKAREVVHVVTTDFYKPGHSVFITTTKPVKLQLRLLHTCTQDSGLYGKRVTDFILDPTVNSTMSLSYNLTTSPFLFYGSAKGLDLDVLKTQFLVKPQVIV